MTRVRLENPEPVIVRNTFEGPLGNVEGDTDAIVGVGYPMTRGNAAEDPRPVRD